MVYVIYSLIRGPIVDWYPYPFLDPAKAGSYAGIAAYSVGIAIGIFMVIWMTVALANRGARQAALMEAAPSVR